MNQEKIQKTEIEALSLDNQLCFALYVCSKEIIRRYKPLLDPLGLTYTGYITLMALWEKDNVAVKDLGERLSLDSGTLTPLLKKLEEQGFVNRKHEAGNDRTVFITLTPAGRKMKSKCEQLPQKMACACSLDAKSARDMMEKLHGMIANMAEQKTRFEK